jgi:hypothetical protein
MTADPEITLGYMIDLSNNDNRPFQYNPSAYEDKYAVSTTNTQIPGLSHFLISGHGGVRTISFLLQYARRDDDIRFVKREAEWIRSLQYPIYTADKRVAQLTIIQFVLGELYNLPCKVTSADVKFFGVFDAETLLPEQADINIVLTEVAVNSIEAGKVRYNGAGFNRSTVVGTYV